MPHTHTHKTIWTSNLLYEMDQLKANASWVSNRNSVAISLSQIRFVKLLDFKQKR